MDNVTPPSSPSYGPRYTVHTNPLCVPNYAPSRRPTPQLRVTLDNQISQVGNKIIPDIKRATTPLTDAAELAEVFAFTWSDSESDDSSDQFQAVQFSPRGEWVDG